MYLTYLSNIAKRLLSLQQFPESTSRTKVLLCPNTTAMPSFHHQRWGPAIGLTDPGIGQASNRRGPSSTARFDERQARHSGSFHHEEHHGGSGSHSSSARSSHRRAGHEDRSEKHREPRARGNFTLSGDGEEEGNEEGFEHDIDDNPHNDRSLGHPQPPTHGPSRNRYGPRGPRLPGRMGDRYGDPTKWQQRQESANPQPTWAPPPRPFAKGYRGQQQRARHMAEQLGHRAITQEELRKRWDEIDRGGPGPVYTGGYVAGTGTPWWMK